MINWLYQNKIILSIVFLSFIFSLTYSFIYRIQPVVDAYAYDQIALNIASGYGFRENIDVDILNDVSIVRAGPGYEYMLAALYRLFGHYYEAVWILQAILHALSSGVLYLAAKRLFKGNGHVIGVVAALVFGFHPDLIEISAMLMTETLYLFFTTIIIYGLVRFFDEPKNRVLAALLGVALAAGVLTRPPLILLVPIVLFIAYRFRAWHTGIIFILALGLSLLPWVVRNYLIYHQLILATLIGEYNLWVGNTLLSNGGQISGGFNAVTNYTDAHGFLNLSKVAHHEFWNFIFTHPVVFVKLCLFRALRYVSLIRPMGFWFYQTGLSQMIFVGSSLIGIAVLFIGGVTGMTILLKEKQFRYNVLVVSALTAPLLLIPTVVQSRYRFQIYPFLAIFAAYAFVKAKQTPVWWKSPWFVAPGAALAVLSAIDILLSSPVIMQRIFSLLQ